MKDMKGLDSLKWIGIFILILIPFSIWYLSNYKNDTFFSVDLIDLSNLFLNSILGVIIVIIIFNISENKNNTREQIHVSNDILLTIISKIDSPQIRLCFTLTQFKNQQSTYLSNCRFIANNIDLLIKYNKNNEIETELSNLRILFSEYKTDIQEKLHVISDSNSWKSLIVDSNVHLDRMIQKISEIRLLHYKTK